MLSEAEAEYLPCILEAGTCHCSEEMRFKIDANVDVDATIEAWMCLVRAQTAADLCESVPAQSGPSGAEANCVGASAEVWKGCEFGTLEVGLAMSEKTRNRVMALVWTSALIALGACGAQVEEPGVDIPADIYKEDVWDAAEADVRVALCGVTSEPR